MQGKYRGELGRWQSVLERLGLGRRQIDAEVETEEPDPATQQAGQTKDNGCHLLQPPINRLGFSRSYRDIKALLSAGSLERGGSGINRTSLSSVGRMRSYLRNSMGKGKQQLGDPSGKGNPGLIDPPEMPKKPRMSMPANEKQRQATVDALKIVHTSQDDPHYNQMAKLVAHVFDVPIAGLIIVDNDRLWWKSLECTVMKRWAESPRDGSCAAHLILAAKHEVMVIEDTQEDARFCDGNVTKDPTSSPKPPRFYAAAPLISPNGYIIGCLGIADLKPRKLDAASFSLLTSLAEVAMRSLIKDAGESVGQMPPPADEYVQQIAHRASHESNKSSVHSSAMSGGRRLSRGSSRSGKRRSLSKEEVGIVICDATSCKILYMDLAATKLSGISLRTACASTLWQLFGLTEGEAATLVDLDGAALCERGADINVETRSGKLLRLAFQNATGSMDQFAPLVGVPSFVEYSQSLDLHCLFVMVRAVERKSPADSAFEDPIALIPCSRESPMMAFAAAIEDEPWGERLEAENQAIPQEPKMPVRRSRTTPDSIAVPYNEELFSAVQIGPLLGRGAFGRVYRGHWHGRQIALKIIDTFQDEDLGERVKDLAEARLMVDVTHPNLVQTYTHATRFVKDFMPPLPLLDLEADSQVSMSILETWLLLEYCNKGSLQNACERGWFRTEPSKENGKPDLGIILATALELAEAMEYLHSRGIVHGDLTPVNVLLSDNPAAPHGFTVKVADFGLSRMVENKSVHTATFGTVTHMPPELLSYGTLTTAADVYSFGVLLWTMWTGEPAWEGLRRTQIIYRITNLLATLPIPQACPSFLKDLLARTMKRDYRARPSFAELVVELGRLVSLEQQGSDLEDCTLPVSSPAARQQSSPSGMSMPTPEVPPCLEGAAAMPRSHSSALPKQTSGRRPCLSAEGTRLEAF